MRFFKLLMFGALVVALFAGVYWLVVRPTGEGDNVLDASGLRHMCVERIKSYGDSLSRYGWKEDYLTAAQVIVDAHRDDLSLSDIDQLESTLQSVFIAKLDSLIRSCYGSNMTDGTLTGTSKLGRAYSGLELVGAKYPAIKSSQRWASLMDLKKTHTDIYAFGQRNFRQPSRIGIYTGWNGDTPYISINNVLDFDRYANGVRSQLTTLTNRRDAKAELRSSPWTSTALNVADVNTKLDEAKTAYLASEKAAVRSYLSGLVRELHGHFRGNNTLSADDARTIIDHLSNIETYLNEKNMSVAGFDDVKSQIRRIYITQ